MTSLLHYVSTEQRKVLWACYDYWKRESCPPEKRAVCFYWVIDQYEKRFGGGFHQSVLRELADMGLLGRGYTVRGGSRRYYTIPDPAQVEILLAGWGLLSTSEPERTESSLTVCEFRHGKIGGCDGHG